MSGDSVRSARVGYNFALVLIGACRRAGKWRTRTIGPDHVVVSLISSAVELTQLSLQLGPKVRELRRALSLRNGDSKASTVTEDASAGNGDVRDLEIDGALREIRWLVFGLGRHGRFPVDQAPQWAPSLRGVVEQALRRADADAVPYAGPMYLLTAALAEPSGRARSLLAHCNVDPDVVLQLARANALPEADEPWTPLARGLRDHSIVQSSDPPARWWRFYSRLIQRLAGGEPTLFHIELEAIRQAVRLGDARTTTAHLVLASLQLDEQLAAAGLRLPVQAVPSNSGGQILTRHRAEYWAAAKEASRLSARDEPLTTVDKKRAWRTKPSNPPWTVSAAGAAEWARADARGRGMPGGTSHLVIAALDDEEGPAAQLVRALGADPAVIVDDAVRVLDSSRM